MFFWRDGWVFSSGVHIMKSHTAPSGVTKCYKKKISVYFTPTHGVRIIMYSSNEPKTTKQIYLVLLSNRMEMGDREHERDGIFDFLCSLN